eukprot:gb/GEZN01009969.1/.p1 GENE.gb/GEZN01009969.1/~~gb/GEZN01009969.1/.p1  ORF type:complete len:274 (+),score=26.18 gb/GEZN01009969.1/:65-886(+)
MDAGSRKITVGKKPSTGTAYFIVSGDGEGKFKETLYLDGSQAKVGVKDRSHFLRAFRHTAADKTEWPSGSTCSSCIFCGASPPQAFLAIRQLVAIVGEKDKRELVTRMMPSLICSSCVSTLQSSAQDGKLLPAAWTAEVLDSQDTQQKQHKTIKISSSLLNAWLVQESFVEHLSQKFIEDNSKKYAKTKDKDVSTVETNRLGQQSVRLLDHNTLKRCGICGTAEELLQGGLKLLACGRCKKEFYCSKACQKAGWKTHKALCNPAVASISVEAH